MTLYPYALGDLIEQPNTYHYSAYHGREFIAAWRQSRAMILADLPPPVPPSPVKAADPDSRQSVDLLEQALSGDAELRESFMKKFEIHKRVHDGYDNTFRAFDKSARRTLPLYLRAADLFATAYEESATARHLNVYLKCLDTLCSIAETLPRDLAARLAWHLQREKAYIDALMSNRGIKP